MSYTVPGGQPQGKPVFVVSKLREAMVAEISAINQYTQHIANSNIEEFNKVWRAILHDEKKHYGMFLTLLRKYDPVQYEAYLYFKNASIETNRAFLTYKPEYDNQLMLNMVREDIKGELETSVLYDQYAFEIACPDVSHTFSIISRDEKFHAEHLTRLMLTYDPEPYDGLT